MDEPTAGVFQLVAMTFGCPSCDVTRQTRADDVDGWDSLSQSILLLGIERRFAVRLDYDEVFNVADVGDLIDCVARAVRAGTGKVV